MIDPDLKHLWVPAGLMLGFQGTLFKWRVEREANVLFGDKAGSDGKGPLKYFMVGFSARLGWNEMVDNHGAWISRAVPQQSRPGNIRKSLSQLDAAAAGKS